MNDTGKLDAKGRKVFRDSKGRTHVMQDVKKIFVKKLFTPKRASPEREASPRTADLCAKWRARQDVNPATGRKISKDG